MRRVSPRFASVILDVDSTLASIEGIDWLARSRGGDLATRIAKITDRAMNGEILLDAVYGERLALVQPTRAELDALGQAYVASLAPGARAAVSALRRAGVAIRIVSGGLKHAILPLAHDLAILDDMVHAVEIHFDDAGAYAGFDTQSPLTRQGGKLVIARSLELARPALAVGDGITDSEMRPALDAFAAFTAFVRREAAVSVADVELTSFDDLVSFVMP
jgi:phosphoserine phosphatase